MAQLPHHAANPAGPSVRPVPLHQRRARGAAVAIAMLFGMAACGDGGDARTASVDSALERDLTLAASATGAVSLGDTAVTAPVAPAPTPATAPALPPSTPPAPAPTTRPAPGPAARTVPPRQDPPVVTTPPAAAPVTATPVTAAPTSTAMGEAAPAAPAGPVDRGRMLGAGSVLAGQTNAAICSIAQRPGDRFVVSLGREVGNADGGQLPAGTPVLVELARVDTASGEFAFRLRGVQVNGEFVAAEGTVRVLDANVTERKVSKGGSDQGRVMTGAVIGSILGRVLGGGARGAVIGAAGGAAAGTVAAARNTTIERCLAAGATLSATLNAPLVLP